ncbi:centrosomal protein of 41 kDa isoform X1 [Embiotoca jacksoni]|uniref:centrosomal protein of 41 kDa isoform X1 n=2 Tax=Embiotoca jacksoni TaxID=100190 RepID=UPI00370383F5
MSLHRGIGSVEYMTKKIPKNAKYEHVKTRLDTGCSLTKYTERVEEMKRNYRYRKDEIFKRLKVTTFAQLILQVSSVSELNDVETDSPGPEDGVSVLSVPDPDGVSEPSGPPHTEPPSQRPDAGDTQDVCPSARSTLLSVISGVGELNPDRAAPRPGSVSGPGSVPGPGPADGPYPACPYLLLDVREREQYDRCHIISALSFPVASLSRTMNPFSRDLLHYKNAAGKIIIVYDEDERTAGQAATAMTERGFDNLFLLCGGLKVIAQKFPSGMITGSIPSSCLSSTSSTSSTSSKEKKPSAAPQLAERRWRFTSEELTKIQEQLEENLVPSTSNSRMSSRMSSSSSRSKAWSRHSSSTADRDSSRHWK